VLVERCVLDPRWKGSVDIVKAKFIRDLEWTKHKIRVETGKIKGITVMREGIIYKIHDFDPIEEKVAELDGNLEIYPNFGLVYEDEECIVARRRDGTYFILCDRNGLLKTMAKTVLDLASAGKVLTISKFLSLDPRNFSEEDRKVLRFFQLANLCLWLSLDLIILYDKRVGKCLKVS